MNANEPPAPDMATPHNFNRVLYHALNGAKLISDDPRLVEMFNDRKMIAVEFVSLEAKHAALKAELEKVHNLQLGHASELAEMDVKLTDAEFKLTALRSANRELAKCVQEALDFSQSVGTEDDLDVEMMAKIEAHAGRLAAALAAHAAHDGGKAP